MDKELPIEFRVLLIEREISAIKLQVDDIRKLADKINSTYWKLETLETNVARLNEDVEDFSTKMVESNVTMSSLKNSIDNHKEVLAQVNKRDEEKAQSQEPVINNKIVEQFIQLLIMILLFVAGMFGIKLA